MARRKRGLVQGNAARVASVPAPVGGWNARDSIASMGPMDAVSIVNMFPTVSNVVLRGGSTNHATGMTGQVRTIFTYAGAATSKMFAAVDTTDFKIYDVTSAGAVGAAVVTGITNAWWEYINITNSGGSYLYAVNGSDKPLLYNGTTWTSIDGSSTPAITGVTTTTLSNIALFKNRVWFIQKDTLKAWYLPTDAVGGAAQVLDLSSIARLGGTLVDIDTWTVDAGYGVDDNLAFITSKGEVIVYRGTDPASAATWALAGVWNIGSPVGARCMLKWGGDLLVLTQDGLMPMAQNLQSSRLDPRVALSNKIQGAISAAIQTYGGSASARGWQIVFSAKNDAVWINVPAGQGKQEQYVMNTITTSWCQFQGWAANCWAIYEDQPYYGGNGVVVKAWTTTYKDNSANIETNTFQAFNYYDSPGVKKYFTRARPNIFTDGTPAIFVGMNVDFNIADTASAISLTTTTPGLWDAGTWDTSLWGAGLAITNYWQGIQGIGYCGAVQLKSASSDWQIQWASTDVVFQTGWAGV